MAPDVSAVRLTQYAAGGGCACKVPPGELERVLAGLPGSRAGGSAGRSGFGELLVGLEHGDDVAAVRIEEGPGGRAVIATADFFTPVVDDAYDWGRIAAANALSDVYAMGGEPLLALNLLGWPRKKIPFELAAEVLRGGAEICLEAGTHLAGGHSIDDPEPKYGLAVTGLADASKLLRNDAAVAGSALTLTKPLGLGVLNNRHKATGERFEQAVATMTTLNRDASRAAVESGIRAATDITGFGLLGHLYKLARASGVTAIIDAGAAPISTACASRSPTASSRAAAAATSNGYSHTWTPASATRSWCCSQTRRRPAVCSSQASFPAIPSSASSSRQGLSLSWFDERSASMISSRRGTPRSTCTWFNLHWLNVHRSTFTWFDGLEDSTMTMGEQMRNTFLSWPVLRQFTDSDLLGRGTAVRSAKTDEITARTVTADRVARSVCPYCAVGCGQKVFVKDEQVVSIEGDPESPISRGRLCPKGAASKNLVTSSMRQTKVRYRRPYGTEWEDLELDVAMEMIADRVVKARNDTWQDIDDDKTVRRTLGIASLGGATLDNEENYLIKKLFTAMGAIQVENQARI